MTLEHISKENIAFIDGQNLYAGVKQAGWSVDYRKLRIYLLEKYKITTAYYFLGYQIDSNQALYTQLKKMGYILVFREHSGDILSKKKGNVDSDIIFLILKMLIENELNGAVYIISGDGDYKRLIDYLISKLLFGKILFPSRLFVSSLYSNLGWEYSSYLDDIHIKSKIRYR